MSLPADTHMGAVHLSVADLRRSLAYYRDAIGLDVIDEGGGEASFGADATELLHLVEQPGARPADGYAGLYHVALLLPERRDLARWLAHAARARVPLVGASDHFVSEAIYLRDPDHHGIEIYWDRPRARWEGQVQRMGTWPLDLDDLLGELDGGDEFERQPPATRVGHVHLRVAAIDDTVSFYAGVVGFDLMAELGHQAAFLSAGGYHHHLGANTWESRGAAPAPTDTARLLGFTIVLPDEATRREFASRVGADDDGTARDPSGNVFALAPAG
ncbi:MAG TPA: VOC family protein [Gaiellaceae bacterium]|nr:VOC family protein [Gaiellaceae bacterium]